MGSEEDEATDPRSPDATGALKADLRRRMLERRRALDPAWVRARSAEACARVAALPAFRTAATVALYLARPGEADPAPLRADCDARGVAVLVPAFDAAAGAWRFARLDRDEPCAVARFGVPQPRTPRWAAPAEAGVILVPGLAFDAAGNRLGHGGGHYDRLLAAGTGLRIGFAFDGQLVAAVPHGPRDEPVDLVVTESRCLDARPHAGAGGAARRGPRAAGKE